MAIGVGVAALLTTWYLAQNAHDAHLVQRANELGTLGRYRQALIVARQVHQPPADGAALLVQAYALAGLGRVVPASAGFRRATARDPNNWVIHHDWAVVLLQIGHRAQATREMNRALALNPRMSLPPGFVRPSRSARRAR